MENNWKC